MNMKIELQNLKIINRFKNSYKINKNLPDNILLNYMKEKIKLLEVIHFYKMLLTPIF